MKRLLLLIRISLLIFLLLFAANAGAQTTATAAFDTKTGTLTVDTSKPVAIKALYQTDPIKLSGSLSAITPMVLKADVGKAYRFIVQTSTHMMRTDDSLSMKVTERLDVAGKPFKTAVYDTTYETVLDKDGNPVTVQHATPYWMEEIVDGATAELYSNKIAVTDFTGKVNTYAGRYQWYVIDTKSARHSPVGYYVATTGSDAAAGTSAAPWKTCAKINRSTFAATDTIYFTSDQTFGAGQLGQDGVSYSDTCLVMPSSGSAGSPIVVTSTGAAKATITGAMPLKGWFPTNDVPDSSGLGRTAVTYGAQPTTVADTTGYNFDGVDDYVDTGSDFIGTGDVTVGVWVYVTNAGQDSVGRIIDNRKFVLRLNTNGRLQLSSDNVSTSIYSANSAVPVAKWVHVVAVRHGATPTTDDSLYVNGVLSGTPGDTGTPAAGSGNVTIGNTSILTGAFNGLIKDLVVLQYCVNADQADSLYDGTLADLVQSGTSKLGASRGVGSELVTNGAFADSTGWTWGAGWYATKTAGKAEGISASGNLTQSALTSRKSYVASATLVRTSGSLKFWFGTFTGATFSSTYSEKAISTGSGTTLGLAPSTYVGTADNISYKTTALTAYYRFTGAASTYGTATNSLMAQYRTTAADSAYALWTQNVLGTRVQTRATCDTNNEWFLGINGTTTTGNTNDYIYLKLTSAADTADVKRSKNYSINGNSKAYVTYNNLDIRGGTGGNSSIWRPAIYLNADGCIVTRCSFSKNVDCDIQVAISGATTGYAAYNIFNGDTYGILFSGSTTGYGVYNNDFLSNSSGVYINSSSALGTLIKNNLFYSPIISFIRIATTATYTGSNNLFYKLSYAAGWIRNSIDYNDIASFATAASSGEGGSMTGWPKFVGQDDSTTAITSYALKSSSKCVNAGVAIAGLTTDYNGDAIIGLPDIGAVEFSSLYYVKAGSGNDTNSGHSWTTAWKTLSQASTAQAVLEGGASTVYTDSTFREMLTVPKDSLTYDGDHGPNAGTVIDGSDIITGWTAEPLGLTFNDSFESGAYTGWTTTQGAIDTYANFGFAAPPDGGTYGAQITSGNYDIVNVSAGKEYWFCGWFRAGSDTTKRTYIGSFKRGASDYQASVSFGTQAEAGKKLRAYNNAIDEPYLGSTVYSKNTWYQIKMRLVVSATVGVIQVWMKPVGGSYNLEIDQTGINTGTQDIVIVTADVAATSNTLTYDVFKVNTTDPDLGTTGYYASAAGDSIQVFENSVRLTKNAVSKASLTVGQWFWESATSRIYLRTFEDAAPTGIEASARDYATRTYEKNYITFSGIHFTKARLDGLRPANSSNITISDCSADYNWGAGYSIYSDDEDYDADINMTSSTASYNGSRGLYLGDYIHTGLVDSCTFDHNGQNASLTNSSGVYIAGTAEQPYGFIVQHSSIYSNGRDSTGTEIAGAEAGYGLWADQVGSNTGANPVIFRYNITYDNANAGLMLENSLNAQAYYNISYDDEDGIAVACSDAGHPSTANRVYNNTVYNATEYGLHALGASCSGALFKNNIVSIAGTSLFFNESAVTDTVNYNLYYDTVLTNKFNWNGATSSTLAAWRTASSQDANSINSDPLFVSTSNYHLTATSPAINKGVAVGLTTDYDGHTIHGLPDIGAYEYPQLDTYAFNSMTRVPRTGAFADTTASISISAAKNEYESFVVAFRSITDSLNVVLAQMSALTKAGSTSIPASASEIFRGTWTYIGTLSDNPESGYTTGFYADNLIPLNRPTDGTLILQSDGKTRHALPYKAEPDSNGYFWVDVKVPATADSGTYSGTFTLTCSDSLKYTRTVSLRVFDFALPNSPTLHTIFHRDIYNQIFTAYGYSTISTNSYATQWQYADLIAKHRINPQAPRRFFPAVDADTGDITATTAKTDSLTYFINKYNLSDLFIQGQYEAKEESLVVRNTSALSNWAAQMKTYMSAQGWYSMLQFYPMKFDEPTTSAKTTVVANAGTTILSGASDFPIFVTVQPHPYDHTWADMRPLIKTYCGHIYYDVSTAARVATLDSVIAEGRSVWQYHLEAHTGAGDPYYGNEGAYWQTDRPLTNYRVVTWIGYHYGMTGFLEPSIFYGTAASSWAPFALDCNGEEAVVACATIANLGYDGAVPTIRLKNFRDGAEDYEYMKKLEGLRGVATVKAITDVAASTWFTFSQTPATYTAQRAAMADIMFAIPTTVRGITTEVKTKVSTEVSTEIK